VEAEAAVEAEVQVEAAEVEAAGEVAEAEEAPPEPARERSRRLPQGRSGMRPGVSPGNMSPAEQVELKRHPVAEEAGLERIARQSQVRHRARRHPRVVERGSGGRRVDDLGNRHRR
jgi:hypothetical protein